MTTISIDKRDLKIGKISLVLLVAYILLGALFYYVAGDQLHYRDSRYNMEMPEADAAAAELSEGVVIEEEFSTDIQRIREIDIRWGTYYRSNSGTATVELIDKETNSQLAVQTIDVSTIEDGGITTLTTESPLGGFNGKSILLRLTADSRAGTAIAPMKNSSIAENGFTLFVNGEETDGILCMSVTGEEYVWIGRHYWQVFTCIGIVILAALFISYRRWRSGKKSIIARIAVAILKYKFLIKQLVARDFKTKYKRSVLGILWSFLNPLLNMGVLYIVFSTLFRFDIEHYPVYLLAGIVMFNFFSESCGLTLDSIVGNAALITKVYVPKYIYPLTRTLSSLINLLISMIPLLMAALISGIHPTKAYLLLPFPLICIMLFSLGMGMLLATSMVFFRDTKFLWGVLSTIWMYLTPIFYPVSIIPENINWILKVNPLYYYVDFLRTCVISGISPDPRVYAICIMWSAGMLALGVLVFKRSQDNFIHYL